MMVSGMAPRAIAPTHRSEGTDTPVHTKGYRAATGTGAGVGLVAGGIGMYAFARGTGVERVPLAMVGALTLGAVGALVGMVAHANVTGREL